MRNISEKFIRNETCSRALRWIARGALASALYSTILTAASAATAPAANVIDMRDLASRVGPIVGSASACPNIAQYRIQTIADDFRIVINANTPTADGIDRDELTRLFDSYIADGRNAVATGKLNCGTVEVQFSSLEQAISTPQPAAPLAPSGIASTPSKVTQTAAITPTTSPPQPIATKVRGVTDQEIRFGIAAPFSGSARELGRQMQLGIETAFKRANDAGGINGRMLRLIAADDGYEPARTLAAMNQLYEKDQVFGFIGNVGTPTAVVAIPYILEHRTLFFGAFTGADILRNNPPDRYVINYRASYTEETDAVVRYLLKIRHIQPRQIAVFAQQDAYGDAGYAGVTKAFRSLGLNDTGILRLNYKRNTIDVDEAINELRDHRPAIKAVVMVATYRAAAKFIGSARAISPNMIFTNVSFVGSTELANELTMMGPGSGAGVIVTQVVPPVSGYSTQVFEYKDALAKYSPGESPDYVSFEGYVAAKILVEALRRTGPQLDTEKLIDTLENMRNIDLGLGVPLNLGRDEHQASHKVWGTEIDKNGQYQPLVLE